MIYINFLSLLFASWLFSISMFSYFLLLGVNISICRESSVHAVRVGDNCVDIVPFTSTSHKLSRHSLDLVLVIKLVPNMHKGIGVRHVYTAAAERERAPQPPRQRLCSTNNTTAWKLILVSSWTLFIGGWSVRICIPLNLCGIAQAPLPGTASWMHEARGIPQFRTDPTEAEVMHRLVIRYKQQVYSSYSTNSTNRTYLGCQYNWSSYWLADCIWNEKILDAKQRMAKKAMTTSSRAICFPVFFIADSAQSAFSSLHSYRLNKSKIHLFNQFAINLAIHIELLYF